MSELRTYPLTLVKIDKATKSFVYDVLVREAEILLFFHNPCNIREEGGRMVCNASTPSYDALASCCAGCAHLTTQGCSVKALQCKLWLCREMRREQRNAPILTAFHSLKHVAEVLSLNTLGGGFRQSKEEHEKSWAFDEVRDANPT